MNGRTKPKGIGIAAIVTVLLMTGSMFSSCVMAQPAQEVSDLREATARPVPFHFWKVIS